MHAYYPCTLCMRAQCMHAYCAFILMMHTIMNACMHTVHIVHACKHTYIHACMHACVHARIHACMLCTHAYHARTHSMRAYDMAPAAPTTPAALAAQAPLG